MIVSKVLLHFCVIAVGHWNQLSPRETLRMQKLTILKYFILCGIQFCLFWDRNIWYRCLICRLKWFFVDCKYSLKTVKVQTRPCNTQKNFKELPITSFVRLYWIDNHYTHCRIRISFFLNLLALTIIFLRLDSIENFK